MSRTPAYLGPADFIAGNVPNMTYTDYWQKREFHDSLVIHMSEQTKRLITAENEMFGDQIRQLDKVEAAQNRAAYEIVCAVEDLKEATEDGLRTVGSMLEWGFSRLLIEQSRTNDLLTDIRNLIANRSLTWAYEMFNRAGNLFRRGHYSDALRSIELAISGHGNELGEATEPGFHYLRGVIRLGGFRNASPDVVDLAEAERSFLLASKYAEHDMPTEAAKAQLCAARAANLRGHYRDAAAHAEKGLGFNDMAGLHYERARALLQLDRQNEAMCHLATAVRRDRRLIRNAIGDPAFAVKPGFVDSAIDGLRRELVGIAGSVRSILEREACAISQVSYASAGTGETYQVDEGDETIASVRNFCRRLREAEPRAGAIDLWKILEDIPALRDRLGKWDRDFRGRLKRAVGVYFADKCARLPEAPALQGPSENAPFHWALATGGVVFLFSCARLVGVFYDPASGSFEDGVSALFGVVAGPVVFGGIAYVIASLLVAEARASVQSEQAKERQSRDFSGAAAAERERIAARIFYSPSEDVLEHIPRWVLGQMKTA